MLIIFESTCIILYRNYYGEKAVDVACRRVENCSPTAKDRIIRLIQGNYIYSVYTVFP